MTAVRPVDFEGNLAVRSGVLRAIRDFFFARDFLEVETPVRIPAPALELNIDAEPSGGWFLRTSPELHMKRLLADGCRRIFQIGPCFRAGERGRLHNPEYTMLEWYRAEADYKDILDDTIALVRSVAAAVAGPGTIPGVAGEWQVVDVRQAYIAQAGWDPFVVFDEDRFYTDLLERIEPSFPSDRPVIFKDYPVEAAALARRKPDRPDTAERWELYLGGMEIANAFSELTDPVEQRRRFERCAEDRLRAGKQVYPMDEEFLAALSRGMPPSGGIALGVDRLAMLLAGASSIDQVRPFCDPR